MALESDENIEQPLAKFESMLKTDDVYFFDAEDFEDIIHHYLNNGKVSLAKKAIKIGLLQHPDSIDIKLLEVEVLVFENNLDIAENILDELQLLDVNNEEIYIQRANICSKQDNHEGAVTLLNKALELSADDFDIQALLGMEYLFMDNFLLAKESFMKCVSYDQEDYSSLYNVVYCFEYLEDYDGAIVYLNEYVERNPYCEVAWHQLGRQFYYKKQYKEALAAYDFAIISDDTFIGAYFEKGKVLEKLGRYIEAIENYGITIKIEDPTSHAYLRIGKCYEKIDNDKMAELYYGKTVHEDPLLDKGWLAFTDFYIKKGDFKKATENINEAINIDGENAHYWKKYAIINKEMAQYDEADFAYKQAVEFGDHDIKTYLDWAQVLRLNKDVISGIQILQKAAKIYSESVKLHYTLAGYYLLEGDELNAKLSFAEALSRDAKSADKFIKEYPQFAKSIWLKNIIGNKKRASR